MPKGRKDFGIQDRQCGQIAGQPSPQLQGRGHQRGGRRRRLPTRQIGQCQELYFLGQGETSLKKRAIEPIRLAITDEKMGTT